MFRFVFHSDPAVNQEGVVIDDLEITGQPLSVEDELFTAISLYPNPSTGIFNIEWTNVTSAQIEVFDITGKRVVSTSVAQGENGHLLNMSNFATGLYILKASLDDTVVTKKLIIK